MSRHLIESVGRVLSAAKWMVRSHNAAKFDIYDCLVAIAVCHDHDVSAISSRGRCYLSIHIQSCMNALLTKGFSHWMHCHAECCIVFAATQ